MTLLFHRPNGSFAKLRCTPFICNNLNSELILEGFDSVSSANSFSDDEDDNDINDDDDDDDDDGDIEIDDGCEYDGQDVISGWGVVQEK